ncbi:MULTISPECIES: ABC transporter substrate-binding protein [Geobacter]|jgi:putative ABC transport system substrate-binding protein|uniref:ABC transporter, periplasmic substrate-binding protein n=3 Tax=Geobacter sulfurreducens TaxID=35554 RepID=Q74D75_GEOSL|nr:ABC transporter substrate-binding protein [Geobacter sulfurreducens]KAB2909715.1 MAG: ABC transporter substrate-binding protein [Dechloromonas sp.]BET57819.1 ABC transporter substrate-binding protein [Geobacter sp. 60473]AAR34818.1 ABC transporter, periplasmic substrate-binding protein [Geobacter sulfurreducens PCA]ADI84283.1 ABC transporter, periplasmic substrate-binding protein [Geobacter sulfurreducens KN400]AJY71675.1 ABC transporter substrate-binding protein [Geobacter sulfurreducens]
MTRIILLILAIILLTEPCNAAQKVFVLQSVRVAPYEEALRGVRSVVSGTIKRVVISEMEGVDVARMVRDERPDVILAIGAEALTRVKRVKDTPIVYLMVLDPQNTLTAGDNLTGVSMNVPPERQLAALQSLMPRLRKIGIPYNPSRSGVLARKAQAAARSMGIEPVARELRSARDVVPVAEGLKGEVDAIWMLPDTTVVTPESIEFLLLFSLTNRIPILTFSDKYVQMGAIMALDIDPYDLGRQGGDLIRRILSGAPVEQVQRVEPRSMVMTVNAKVARKLGLTLSEEALGRARVIR